MEQILTHSAVSPFSGRGRIGVVARGSGLFCADIRAALRVFSRMHVVSQASLLTCFFLAVVFVFFFLLHAVGCLAFKEMRANLNILLSSELQKVLHTAFDVIELVFLFFVCSNSLQMCWNSFYAKKSAAPI